MTFAIFYFTSSSILRNSFPAREERRDHLPVGSATIEGLRDRGLRDRDMGGDMSSSSERRSSPDRVRDSEWSSLVEPNKLPDLDRVTNSSSSSSGNIVSLLICIISSSKMSIEPRREWVREDFRDISLLSDPRLFWSFKLLKTCLIWRILFSILVPWVTV